MNFQILPEAEREAIEAALWYDEKQIGLGNKFLAELRVGFEFLKSETC